MNTPGRGPALVVEMERFPRLPFVGSESSPLQPKSSEYDTSTQSSGIGAGIGGESSFRPGWSSASVDSGRRFSIRKEGSENNRPDKWSSSIKVRRGVGVLAFLAANCAVILGFLLSVACRACYGSRGSQVNVPDQFAVTDTLRESPTRWIGLVLFTCSTILLVLLGWFRHKQIRQLSDAAFPALLRQNFFSVPFGISSCVSFMVVATIPPSFDENLLVILRMGSFSLGIGFTAMYVIIQCVWIEKHLVSTEVIASSPHKLRKALLLLGGIMAFAAFALFVIRKDISTKAGRSEDSAMAVGVLLLFFEAGSSLLIMAALCLTDFGSLCVNVSKLERLQKTMYITSISCKLSSTSKI